MNTFENTSNELFYLVIQIPVIHLISTIMQLYMPFNQSLKKSSVLESFNVLVIKKVYSVNIIMIALSTKNAHMQRFLKGNIRLNSIHITLVNVVFKLI